MPRWTAAQRVRGVAAICCAALALGCGDGPVTPGGAAELRLHASLGDLQGATLVLDVSGAGMPSALTFNFPVQDGSVSGTLKVPAGSSRLITGHVFDAGGRETHRGTATVDLVSGQNPPVSLDLAPLTGDVPVQVSFGAYFVVVKPGVDTLRVGGGRQLSAVMISDRGDTVPGTFEWFSTDPRVATVAATGQVLARDTGRVRIVAGRLGVAGAAVLRVLPAEH